MHNIHRGQKRNSTRTLSEWSTENGNRYYKFKEPLVTKVNAELYAQERISELVSVLEDIMERFDPYAIPGCYENEEIKLRAEQVLRKVKENS